MLLPKLCEEHHHPWSDLFAGQNAVSGKCFSTTWRILSVGLCYSSTVFQVAYPHVINPVDFFLITAKRKSLERTNKTLPETVLYWLYLLIETFTEAP